MESYEIKLFSMYKPNKKQFQLLKNYFLEMPINDILAGLKFARNRWIANHSGVLKVGRKSIVSKETHSITLEQAKWRLKNWDIMINNYKKYGYSYTTIYRIKRKLSGICRLD